MTMDITYDEPHQLFRILDVNGDGSVGITEIVRGFMRIRGEAKSKDLLAIRALVYRCHHEQLKEFALLKQVREELREDFKQMFALESRMQADGSAHMNKQAGCIDSEKPIRYSALSRSTWSSDQISGQLAKIRAHVDGLISGSDNVFVNAGPTLQPTSQLQVNVSLQRAVDVPVSETKALLPIRKKEVVPTDFQNQFEQLQQEFLTLQRWLDFPPKGMLLEQNFPSQALLASVAPATCSRI